MIKLENTTIHGWEEALRGMRNPMNSWAKSDSYKGCTIDKDDLVDHEKYPIGAPQKCDGCTWCEPLCYGNPEKQTYIVGPNDHNLMLKLANGGPVHAKYRRMIVVYVDITAPLYWWKEFDTYKVGTVANSCSTMHKIAEKEFELDDFSHEHLTTSTTVLESVIRALNIDRDRYIKTKDKNYWWQMIQLLPSSYNQRRTIVMNYEVLASVYPMRKDHKLDEWHTFCDWIKKLPYSDVIIPK